LNYYFYCIQYIYMMKAAVASVTLNDEAKAIIRNILDPKFDISFNGYNNMS